MRSRGIAYTLVGLRNINLKEILGEKSENSDFDLESLFDTLEKVVLAKLNDFNTHDLIKTFVSFYEMG